MTTQKDVTEKSASESQNISEGNADDEVAGEESSQTSPLASQESEEVPMSVSAEAEPTTNVTRYRAQEEIKLTGDMSTEDMEVVMSKAAMSKVASTAGGIMPMSSQDVVIVHVSEEEVRSNK